MNGPLLAVVPCRGQSKRIPRKWAALVDGKPLLQHTIDIARAAATIDRLIVSTEDPAIAAYARLRGVEVHQRPDQLAADDVPLSDVVAELVNAIGWEDNIAVLQPTCPLLKSETIDRIVSGFQTGRHAWANWVIAATPEPHILWRNGNPITPRVNSQQLVEDLSSCVWRESGAIQVMTAEAARGGATRRTIVPIDPAEALDIDTYADLEAARAVMGRKTILFHVVASDEKGSGHLRRCLQLSDALSHHDVWWDHVGLEEWARAEAAGLGVRFADAPDSPDLAIIDALGAADRLVPMYASHGVPTVVFEPDGAPRASRFADLVIDEFDTPELAVLRPEFGCLPPFEVKKKAQNVLITFGGTDPNGMNHRVSRIVRHGADATVLVAGRDLRGSMAEWLRWADLVICSQGRTVHEAAAVGVPCLSIAVNERESRHAQLPGVVYLGLAHTLSDVAILDTANRLLGSESIRREMSLTASKAIDGKGLGRVVRKIEDLLA